MLVRLPTGDVIESTEVTSVMIRPATPDRVVIHLADDSRVVMDYPSLADAADAQDTIVESLGAAGTVILDVNDLDDDDAPADDGGEKILHLTQDEV